MTEANPEHSQPRSGTIALIGRPNVGKSTLLNALLGEKIAATTHKPQTTRRQLRGVLTVGDAQMVFVDTPGLHDTKGELHAYMVSQALAAASTVDVNCLLVEPFRKSDGTAELDRRDAAILNFLDERVLEKDRPPTILVVNKIDRFSDKVMLLPVLQAFSAAGKFDAIIPISAEKRDGLNALQAALIERLPEGAHLYDDDALTDANERDICAELIREKAMLELSEELPYRLGVVIEEFDEAQRYRKKKPLARIAALLVVERESQKGIVIGKQGARIKTIGQRARKDIERLLGCQVMLKLFVKVEPDWTQSRRGLAKLGYSRN